MSEIKQPDVGNMTVDEAVAWLNAEFAKNLEALLRDMGPVPYSASCPEWFANLVEQECDRVIASDPVLQAQLKKRDAP